MKERTKQKLIASSASVFEDERKFFRCPACGEIVDSSNIAEVVEHHRHVLNPALYPYARKTAT
jgi:hypothetical protein